MKKILFIIPTLTNGGAERVASIVANYLSDYFEIAFFFLKKGNGFSYEINPKIRTIFASNATNKPKYKLIKIIKYLKDFSCQYKILSEVISDFHPDCVLSFLPKADFFAYMAKKYFSFKWISSERNDPTVRNFFERHVLQHIYRKTDCFVCQSDIVVRYYKNLRLKKCVKIQNPLNDGVVLNEHIPYENYAIAVGRFDAQKNYKMLIDSFLNATTEIDSKVKLLILGNGPLLEKCKDLVKQRNAFERVLFLGRKINVGDYLRKAKFFVMTSNYEGMPNALIEAMNASLPVICTDFFTGTARELISDDNGILVPVNNSASMTNAIKQMLSMSQEKLREMGENSQKKLSCMNVGNVCQMWHDLIISLV